METILKFFQEDNGSHSIMRVICFVFALHAVFTSGFIIVNNVNNWAGAIAVFTSISGVAITGKLIQKPMEGKPDPPTGQV